MNGISHITQEAYDIIAKETHDRLVAAEVARLRGLRDRSLWRRLIDSIFPFTITIRRNS